MNNKGIETIITSTQNALIKETLRLHQKKHRHAEKLLLVETRHPIEEALNAGCVIKQFFAQEHASATQFPQNLPANAPTVTVSEAVMKKLATTESAPPCLAVMTAPASAAALENLLKTKTTPLILLLDGIQDPGNLGTLIRSAVAFGVTGLLTTDNTADVYSPKVIRASAGLVFRLPIVSGTPTLASLGNTEITWYWATPAATATPYKELDFTRPCGLVLGSEGSGIRDTLKDTLPLVATTIPMASQIDSLNVAVSGAILLAEASAQRGVSST